MSYYAELDNEAKAGGDVATISGWAVFARWVESLEIDTPELSQLCEHGLSEDLPTLEKNLEAALTEGGDSSSEDIARGLLGMVKARADAKVIVVTDGSGGGA